jgi:hypothetical protein
MPISLPLDQVAGSGTSASSDQRTLPPANQRTTN